MARTAFTLPATWAEEPAKSTSTEAASGIEAQSNCDLAQAIGHAVVVQPILRAEIAGGHGAQFRAHQPLGIIEQLLDQRLQLRFAVLLYQLQHPLLADAAGANLRLQVAFALFRGAHVEQNQVQHLAIDLAAAHNPYWRDADALLKNFVCRSHRSGKGSSHVRMVGAVGNIEGGLIHVPAKRPEAPW